jgi:hypothetical protein
MTLLQQLLLFLALTLALTSYAYGVKLYKWTDEDGRVTYQDRPPPAASGNVEEKNINPNQNRADSFVPPPSNADNPPAAGRHRNAADEVDTPASRAAAARRHRRTIQGGGAVDAGGSNPGAPPAPPAPPPSVPAGTGGG